MRWIFTHFLSFIALLVWGVSASYATVLNVSTAGELQSALNTAVAGDEIVLANGTYSQEFVVNGSNGTASQPITVRAANPHQAILEAPTPGCNWAGDNGITIYRSYWIFRDLRMRNQNWGMYFTGTGATNNTIQDMIIEDYRGAGIMLHEGADNNLLQNTVIGYSDPACNDSPDDVGIRIYNSSNNTVRNNIVPATGNNGTQCGGVGGCNGATGDKTGYGIFLEYNSASAGSLTQNNVLQGNLLLANGGKGVFRILNASYNIARDNAILFGEGGGLATDDCIDEYNSLINNIAYGNFFVNLGTKGNYDGTKGHHLFQHNLVHSTAFSKGTMSITTGGCTGIAGDPVKTLNTMKDNLLISNSAQAGPSSQSWVLLDIDNENSALAVKDRNLFWAPGATNTWTSGYTPANTDIYATGSAPVFTNAAQGDFSLAEGSPGKRAASDCLDIGIQYNAYLKKTWLAQVFALATQQATGLNASTSTSFTVNPTRYHQVFFYIPSSSPCAQTAQTFTIEGTTVLRDITGLINGGWVQPGGPARWITLGRHLATDGTLNIAWQNTNCAEGIFIRELPTADEAYAWIAP